MDLILFLSLLDLGLDLMDWGVYSAGRLLDRTVG